MNRRSVRLISVLVLALAGCASSSFQNVIKEPQVSDSSIPQIRDVGHTKQIYIDGKPFLALGGELGNSNASDLKVLDDALAKCKRMNLNTIMLPVYWDLIEREEGRFDFSLVQGAIDRARAHDVRLVYLWFGTWKNGMSCYAPGWMKRDTARFRRVKQSNGESLEVVSPASKAACEADARAFAALMRWTKQYDVKAHTVILAQVENEIGMMPEARDHSELSETAYKTTVPTSLTTMPMKYSATKPTVPMSQPTSPMDSPRSARKGRSIPTANASPNL